MGRWFLAVIIQRVFKNESDFGIIFFKHHARNNL
jgi:hypothetical protein